MTIADRRRGPYACSIRSGRIGLRSAPRGGIRSAQPAVAADPRLAVDVLGLHFPNPIGLAAGLDKDAMIPDAMLALGFGFVEIGT